jgi:hypothetical protein
MTHFYEHYPRQNAMKNVGGVFYNSLVTMSTFYVGLGSARGFLAKDVGLTKRVFEAGTTYLAGSDLYSTFTGWEKPELQKIISFGLGASSMLGLASGAKLGLSFFNDFNDAFFFQPQKRPASIGAGYNFDFKR